MQSIQFYFQLLTLFLVHLHFHISFRLSLSVSTSYLPIPPLPAGILIGIAFNWICKSSKSRKIISIYLDLYFLSPGLFLMYYFLMQILISTKHTWKQSKTYFLWQLSDSYTNWVSKNLILYYPKLAQTPKIEGSVPQDCPHFRHQSKVPSPKTLRPLSNLATNLRMLTLPPQFW